MDEIREAESAESAEAANDEIPEAKAATAADVVGLDYAAERSRPRTALWLLLGIIVFLVVGTHFRFRADVSRTPNTAVARMEITSFQTALDAFAIDNGRYPKSSEGLDALVNPPSGLSDWHGPYISKSSPVRDPWNVPYLYTFSGIRHPTGFDLSSNGPDGKPNTADDITN